MYKIKNRNGPLIFHDQFSEINHNYQTRYSNNAFKIPKAKLDLRRFSIRYRGPHIWNNFLNNDLKKQSLETSPICFKQLTKRYVMNQNAQTYF